MIYEALETLGINKKEADLYTKLLALGAQPASILARRLNIPRSTAQFLAESLVQKGVASKQKTRNVIHYQPIDPEELPQLLKSKKSVPCMNSIKKKSSYKKQP
jgi:sugar-specific transcriptional regulator TrmB